MATDLGRRYGALVLGHSAIRRYFSRQMPMTVDEQAVILGGDVVEAAAVAVLRDDSFAELRRQRGHRQHERRACDHGVVAVIHCAFARVVADIADAGQRRGDRVNRPEVIHPGLPMRRNDGAVSLGCPRDGRALYRFRQRMSKWDVKVTSGWQRSRKQVDTQTLSSGAPTAIMFGARHVEGMQVTERSIAVELLRSCYVKPAETGPQSGSSQVFGFGDAMGVNARSPELARSVKYVPTSSWPV